jgi:hypothetical protein
MQFNTAIETLILPNKRKRRIIILVLIQIPF